MVLAPPLGRGLLALPVGAQRARRVGTVNLASVLVRARGGQPGCRVPVAYLRHAQLGVSMKPCGHDRDELNHLRRPHRLVGHAVPELRRGRARHHAASVARQRISPSRRP